MDQILIEHLINLQNRSIYRDYVGSLYQLLPSSSTK